MLLLKRVLYLLPVFVVVMLVACFPPSLGKSDRTKGIAVYICDNPEDEMQQRKINELHHYFGNELYIVTANRGPKSIWSVPKNQVVSDGNLPSFHQFKCNDACTGMERALMWLIELGEREPFHSSWVLTQDFYWKNFDSLREVFETYRDDPTDLLHQNDGMEDQPVWSDAEMETWNYEYLQPPWVQSTAEAVRPYYKGLFWFFRASRDMILSLKDWKHRNNGNWTFYEPLLATLSVQDSRLTTKSYINGTQHTFCLNYRPCFGKEDIEGTTDRCPGGDFYYPVIEDYGACTA